MKRYNNILVEFHWFIPEFVDMEVYELLEVFLLEILRKGNIPEDTECFQ